MSLRKKPVRTAARVAASRANGRHSLGPATPQVRQGLLAAHERQGFNLQAEETALRALGEDPTQFQNLLEGIWLAYSPTNAVQEALTFRLARSTWLMNRADRMLEGYAVRRAEQVSLGRQERSHVQMMLLKMAAERLRRLVEAVASRFYVTPLADLEAIKRLDEDGALQEMGEMAVALFCQLQLPNTDENGVTNDEKAQKVIARMKEIFGVGMTGLCAPPRNPFAAPNPFAPLPAPPAAAPPSAALGVAPVDQEDDEEDDDEEEEEEEREDEEEEDEDDEDENVKRYPQISPADWELRERPRQLLENILRRQAEICEARRQSILKESLSGPSPYERAAEVAPTHPHAILIRRMQDANFRELRRVTNLLLKLKRWERREQ